MNKILENQNIVLILGNLFTQPSLYLENLIIIQRSLLAPVY